MALHRRSDVEEGWVARNHSLLPRKAARCLQSAVPPVLYSDLKGHLYRRIRSYVKSIAISLLKRRQESHQDSFRTHHCRHSFRSGWSTGNADMGGAGFILCLWYTLILRDISFLSQLRQGQTPLSRYHLGIVFRIWLVQNQATSRYRLYQ